jgi:hypothetical protein
MKIIIKHFKHTALARGLSNLPKTTLANYEIETYEESKLVSSEGLYLVSPSKYNGTMRLDITDGNIYEEVVDNIVLIQDESISRWRLATKLPYAFHRTNYQHICFHYKNSAIPSSLHAIYIGEKLTNLYLEYEFMPKDIKEELRKFTLLIT